MHSNLLVRMDSDADVDSIDLETPYFQPLAFPGSSQIEMGRPASCRQEPLRVGDVIQYTNPMFVAGNRQGRRTTQIVAISDGESEFLLKLDNGELLPGDTRIKRIAELVPEAQKLYSHSGIFRPIDHFLLVPGCIKRSKKQTGAARQFEQIKATLHSMEKQQQQIVENTYPGNLDTDSHLDNNSDSDIELFLTKKSSKPKQASTPDTGCQIPSIKESKREETSLARRTVRTDDEVKMSTEAKSKTIADSRSDVKDRFYVKQETQDTYPWDPSKNNINTLKRANSKPGNEGRPSSARPRFMLGKFQYKAKVSYHSNRASLSPDPVRASEHDKQKKSSRKKHHRGRQPKCSQDRVDMTVDSSDNEKVKPRATSGSVQLMPSRNINDGNHNEKPPLETDKMSADDGSFEFDEYSQERKTIGASTKRKVRERTPIQTSESNKSNRLSSTVRKKAKSHTPRTTNLPSPSELSILVTSRQGKEEVVCQRKRKQVSWGRSHIPPGLPDEWMTNHHRRRRKTPRAAPLTKETFLLENRTGRIRRPALEADDEAAAFSNKLNNQGPAKRNWAGTARQTSSFDGDEEDADWGKHMRHQHNQGLDSRSSSTRDIFMTSSPSRPSLDSTSGSHQSQRTRCGGDRASSGSQFMQDESNRSMIMQNPPTRRLCVRQDSIEEDDSDSGRGRHRELSRNSRVDPSFKSSASKSIRRQSQAGRLSFIKVSRGCRL